MDPNVACAAILAALNDPDFKAIGSFSVYRNAATLRDVVDGLAGWLKRDGFLPDRAKELHAALDAAMAEGTTEYCLTELLVRLTARLEDT